MSDFKLVLDTSNEYLYVSVLSGNTNEVLSHHIQVGNNNHSETLVNVIKEVLDKLGITPADLTEIWVGRGPGSYTGVRVACCVAKVMAYVLKIKLFYFSSLDLLYSRFLQNDGVYKVHMDARRGFTYAKVVEIKEGKVKIIRDETYLENVTLDNEYKEAIDVNQKIGFSIEESYDIKALANAGLLTKVEDIHRFVPKYLRSGI